MTQRLVLAAAEGDPPIQLLDLDTGEVTPVPTPMDGCGPFDTALPRRGWVAVALGYQVAAFRDGELGSPTLLPPSWGIRPAAGADEVLLRRYLGRSRRDGEASQLLVVGPDGEVRRSASLVVEQVVGEVDGAIITGSGAWTWGGDALAPFAEGEAIGVLGGRAVVHLRKTGRHRRVDVVAVGGRSLGTCDVPDDARFSSGTYDADGTRFASTSSRHAGVLVADATAGPRWMPLPIVPWAPVWLADGRLWLGELADPSRAVVLDVASGSIEPLPLDARAPFPRVDVSGRVDAVAARDSLVVEAWTAPTPATRDASLATQRDALVAAVPERLRGLTDRALPSVRLRPVIRTGGPDVGASRLGGRPDLPPGEPWPSHDGAPMALLAQLRLPDVSAAAPDGALPRDGLLLVFVGLEADGGFPPDPDAVHVAIVDLAASAPAPPWPDDLDAELRYDPVAVVAEPLLSVPSWPDELGLDDVDDWWAAIAEIHPAAPHHRLLGHPVGSGDDGPFGAEEPHTLLIQVASDSAAHMMFGDGGSLAVWVPTADLERGDLSRCTVDLRLG